MGSYHRSQSPIPCLLSSGDGRAASETLPVESQKQEVPGREDRVADCYFPTQSQSRLWTLSEETAAKRKPWIYKFKGKRHIPHD